MENQRKFSKKTLRWAQDPGLCGGWVQSRVRGSIQGLKLGSRWLKTAQDSSTCAQNRPNMGPTWGPLSLETAYLFVIGAFRSCFTASLAQDGRRIGPTWLKLGQHSLTCQSTYPKEFACERDFSSFSPPSPAGDDAT